VITENPTKPQMHSYNTYWSIVNLNTCFRLSPVFWH